MKELREPLLSSGGNIIIDPPEGWRYGFPKELPLDVYEDENRLADWLVKQGYPEDQLELALQYSRTWYA